MSPGDKELASRLMGDMDPELLQFLKSYVTSFIKWDLMRFFHDNPYATDTAENIARFIGRDRETVADELAEMVESGVLQSHQVGDLIVYMLATDPRIRELMDRFVLACDDRQFRIKAIYHIIRGST
ncbi:MAG: hypothetical protein C4310_08450 [Chloroflexota bacterium]